MLPTLRRAALTWSVVLPLGCATQVALPPLPDCHPANPAAPSAPLSPPSALLDAAAPVPAAPPREGMDHEGMDHEGTDQEGTDHEGMDHEGMDHDGMETEEAAVYVCPMHPDVRSDTPGTCPVCGMELVETERSHEPQDEAEPDPHRHHGDDGSSR